MDFTIWAIGDSGYLASILQNVAMLVGTGMPYQLAMIGMTFSVLLLAVQGTLSGGQGIPFQNLLIGWVLFAVLFGPPVTVVINDTYSARTTPVDGVPFGIAAMGSMLSTIGHEITEELEQGFSLPTMTDNGFAVPLKMILNARDLDLASASIGGVDNNETPQGNFHATMVNYIQDCTMVGIQRGDINAGGIKTAAYPFGAMKFESEIYGTYLDLPGVGDPNRNCTEAWNIINDRLHSADFWISWEPYLTTIFGPDPISNLQASLDAIVGFGEDAQQYMLTSVTRDIFEKGSVKGQLSTGDIGSALITSQAREQRNIQWAAESSLFMTIVRPMMTFMEALFYCLTPFMAFLVVLVPLGPKMIGKYFLLAIWVQLWMPTMAILNFYINYIAQRKLQEIKVAQKLDLSSFQGLSLASTQLADWLATAGTLAASTPALTLSLIYGSAITATHLASRMQGGDHINEKLAAPDAATVGAGVNMASMYQHDQASGLHKSGMGQMVPRINLSDNLSSSQESAKNLREGSTQEFMSGLSAATGGSQAFMQNWKSSEDLGRQIASSNTQSSDFINQVSSQVGNKLGFSNNEETMNAFRGELAAGLGSGKGLGGAIKGALQNTYSDKEGRSMEETYQQAEQALGSDKTTAAFAAALSHDMRDGKDEIFSKGIKEEHSQKFGDTAKKTASADDSYKKATSQQQAIGSQTEANVFQLGRLATANGKLGDLQNLANEQGLGSRVNDLTQRYMSDFGKGREEANAAALFHALDESAHRSPENNAAFLEAVSSVMGKEPPHDMGNPAANASTASGAEAAGRKAQREAQNADYSMAPPQGQANQAGQGVKDKAEGRLEGAQKAVVGDHAQNRLGVENQAAEAKRAGHQETADRLHEKIADDSRSPAQQMFDRTIGTIDAGVDAVSQTMTGIMAYGDGALLLGQDAAVNSYNSALDAYQAKKEEYQSFGEQFGWDQNAMESERPGFLGSLESFANKVAHAANVVWDGAKQEISAVGGAMEAGGNAAVDRLQNSGYGPQASFDAMKDTFHGQERQKAMDAGLTEDQADLYAAARTDIASRLISGISTSDGGVTDFTRDGWLSQNVDGYDKNYGIDTGDKAINEGIIRAAETGNTAYLDDIGKYNEQTRLASAEVPSENVDPGQLGASLPAGQSPSQAPNNGPHVDENSPGPTNKLTNMKQENDMNPV